MLRRKRSRKRRVVRGHGRSGSTRRGAAMVDSLSRLWKAVALVGVGTLGAATGVGFVSSDKDTQRREVTVHADADRVWELLSDPKNTPRWMPKDLLDIDRVEEMAKGDEG